MIFRYIWYLQALIIIDPQHSVATRLSRSLIRCWNDDLTNDVSSQPSQPLRRVVALLARTQSHATSSRSSQKIRKDIWHLSIPKISEDCHCQPGPVAVENTDMSDICPSFSNRDLRQIYDRFNQTFQSLQSLRLISGGGWQSREQIFNAAPFQSTFHEAKWKYPPANIGTWWHVHTIAHRQTTKSTNRKPKTPRNFAPFDGLRKKSGSYFSCYLSCCLSIPISILYT